MRNYAHIDTYISELYSDIYPQPPDPGHTAWAIEVIDRWKDKWKDAYSVLDVGCGHAFLQDRFVEDGLIYTGVCLADDYTEASALGRNVICADFHFLSFFHDNQFDLVFSRHSLEHSPMPLLALMEWHRIARTYLCLVLPNADFFGKAGRNHYSVMWDEQARFLLGRVGWEVIDGVVMEHELQYLCKKVQRVNKWD